MRNILFFLLLLVAQFATSQIESKPISDFISFDESAEVLLDVRTPAEFDAGCIDGAVNINWLSDEFNQQIKGMDKSKKIFVYCKMGGRSLKSQERLVELGFKNVVNLEGGYDAYSSK
ncbi:rhodanese-like domain-containing protein [Maribacter sp. BPC-D8]|uniref:rhodanese-like domain-containing protein n=1 Tax=Maribacter sp. BPC-D8 TaxID=3053613 RepID=UPI002B48D9C4|nr:rhodanese-like domain-containing protein [Maribacter sp. BPC-D8]WRI28073.1 rhodanese-like domain-containing protein [Maribacter sp. BPC-D8]